MPVPEHYISVVTSSFADVFGCCRLNVKVTSRRTTCNSDVMRVINGNAAAYAFTIQCGDHSRARGSAPWRMGLISNAAMTAGAWDSDMGLRHGDHMGALTQRPWRSSDAETTWEIWHGDHVGALCRRPRGSSDAEAMGELRRGGRGGAPGWSSNIETTCELRHRVCMKASTGTVDWLAEMATCESYRV